MSDSSLDTARPKYWRTLEDLAATETLSPEIEKEFPIAAQFWLDQPSRRSFLQRMAASLALAGLTGCVRQPTETIVSAIKEPEHRVPGRAQFFASAMPVSGGAIGLLVESHDGRPTKVDGNPLHPSSQGATDIFAQASVLDLYDPDRSQVVLNGRHISNWPAFLAMLSPRIASHRAKQGAGLHILTGRTSSPTLLAQLSQVLAEMPRAIWTEYEPFPTTAARRGTELATGTALDTRLHLDQVDVILSIDSNFLGEGPAKLRLAKEFADRRRVEPTGAASMSRLYVAESTLTLTGARADHRLPLKPSQLTSVLAAVARGLGVDLGDWKSAPPSEINSQWIAAAVADLKSAGSRALVVAGASMPPEAHAVCLAINAALGSLGSAVTFLDPIDRPKGASPQSLPELIETLDSGNVETLIILGENPFFDAPAASGIRAAITQAAVSIHLATFADETSAACTWHVPETHYLESWSDVRSEDGTASIVQPLIAPLYRGKSPHELMNVVLGHPEKSAYDTVREFWRNQVGAEGFENHWKKSLHEGIVEGTASPAQSAAVRADFAAQLAQATSTAESATPSENDLIQIAFRPHPTVSDGRFANNGWLQELPQPFTSLTWTSAAHLSPADAQSLGVTLGDLIRITVDDREVEVPACVLPGQPEGVITLHAGQGRKKGGRNSDEAGVDVYPLRSGLDFWTTAKLVQPAGRVAKLSQTQTHHLMEGRDLVRGGTLAEFNASPTDLPFMHVGHGEHENVSLYPEWEQEGPQWGMSVNLGACIGCSACVIACQSENNIPIVGAEQVANSREMHWLRIDTYFSGEPEDPSVHFQPLMCMHCEHAPCEPMCPVGATTHSSDGLNEMTYNRCIGTRYCSNNCPYKVRRFNFLDYRTELKELPVLQLQQNPNVSVRSRGVMEKCTFCVQRISAARIHAEMQGREIREGEVVTACQSACPTRAITFGNIRDEKSAVAKEKSSPLNYSLLEELNTRPRLTYLAELRNPNPALASTSAAAHSAEAAE